MLMEVPPSVRKEVEEPLKQVMNYFEVIGFAPDEISNQLKNKKTAKENLAQLEKVLSKAVRLGANSETVVELHS